MSVKENVGFQNDTFLPHGPSVIENSVFRVWKNVGPSQRIIWAGNRSNEIFNPEASIVELPTPDLLASLSMEEGKSLHLASCDISQYYKSLKGVSVLGTLPRPAQDPPL